MNKTPTNVPLRIKSPQLYQLSYQPKIANALAYQERNMTGASPVVSLVYPDVFTSRAYHGSGVS